MKKIFILLAFFAIICCATFVTCTKNGEKGDKEDPGKIMPLSDTVGDGVPGNWGR